MQLLRWLRHRSLIFEASENGCYVTVWVPEDEETERQAKSADAGVPVVRRVSVAEQNGSCVDAVDVEPLKYYYSMGVKVAGGKARGTCVLETVLDSGSGSSIIRWTGLRRLQCQLAGLPTVHPYEGGPSMTGAGGRGYKISLYAGVLTVHVLAPWAPVRRQW